VKTNCVKNWMCLTQLISIDWLTFMKLQGAKKTCYLQIFYWSKIWYSNFGTFWIAESLNPCT
jgi:hypothetical protein